MSCQGTVSEIRNELKGRGVEWPRISVLPVVPDLQTFGHFSFRDLTSKFSTLTFTRLRGRKKLSLLFHLSLLEKKTVTTIF